MYSDITGEIFMKKVSVVIAFLGVMLNSCGFYMIKQTNKSELNAKPDMAQLVIYRATAYGCVAKYNNFLDDKFIGQTQCQCYFVTDVSPGWHYVIADAENKACAKINFEAGKVYYLLQAIYPGLMAPRSGFIGSNPKDFQKDLPDMVHYNCCKEGKYPTLTKEEYEQVIATYESELKSDLERHRDTYYLKGY
jgi:hypothetical protein